MASPPREQGGFGVAFLLILIAAASLALVTLLERTGLAVQRAGFDLERQQARCLALAGAEHAVWRLQHEACFLARNDSALCTQTFGPGEYSYRVTGVDQRVSIEASGSVGSAHYTLNRRIDRLPSPARAMLVYGFQEMIEPRAREYAAGSWTGEAGTATLAKDAAWCVLRGSSSRRERLLASLDQDGILQLQVWSGDAGWRSLGALSASCDPRTRCFDIAYESRSGRALIAYRKGSDGDLYFRFWNGALLGPEQTLDLPFTGALRWVTLAPRRDADDIALVAIGSDKRLAAAIWTAGAFGGLRILANSLDRSDFEVGAVTYIAGGTALFAWSAANALGEATWQDEWLAATSLPFAAEARALRLVARPAGGGAQLAMLSSDLCLTAMIWKSGWWDVPTLKTITTHASTEDWRCFDVAYTGDGLGLLVYGVEGSTLLQTAVWTPMFGWLPAGAGPDVGGTVRIVRLAADTAANLVHICVLSERPSGELDLQLAAWKGRWTGLSPAATGKAAGGGESFMPSTSGDVCLP